MKIMDKLRLVIAEQKRKGIMQQAVADTSGMHRQTIAKWLRGETSPRLHDLEAVANTCGYNLTWNLEPIEDKEDE